MNFVFYDTETTGINTAFSQILQFGAILTDSELNELERFEIRCRLLPHVIPAPGAMKVTGVRLNQLLDPNIPTHYQMICAIKEKLSQWSPATFIGYNTIDFDEHLLRQAFYQTLHPIYLTNSNGNCRMDALTMVQAASLFAPDCLKIPTGEKGPIFKLDQLAPLNGFDHSKAHDAMSDVEATIYIAKLIKQRAPELWDNLSRCSKKASVIEFVTKEELFLLSDFYFGKPYSYFVTVIGTNPDKQAEFFVADLCEDPLNYVHLSDEELTARFKRNPKPIRKLKSNGFPTIRSFAESHSFAAQLNLGAEELKRRAQFLKCNPQICERIAKLYAASRGERVVSEHVEEQIYDGFFEKDQHILNKFHNISWEERRDLINNIQDKRLKTLALRLLYCERPDLIEEKTRKEWEVAMAKRLISSDPANWLTLPAAIQEAEELLSSAAAHEVELLHEHKEYLRKKLQEMQSLIA